MDDSILSQAEIDELLNGDKGSAEPKAASNHQDDVKRYDPMTQKCVVYERLHALELINERFARYFRIGLFASQQHSTDITVGPIKIQTYHEFARHLSVLGSFNLVHLKPLRGTALFVFEQELVFTVVNNLFGGGDGRLTTKVEDREFTQIEQPIIVDMLGVALKAYSDAWRAIYKLDVEYVRSETQMKFTNITSSPNDIVITTLFNMEIGTSGSSSQFNICIPLAMVEPLRKLLASPPVENSREEDQHWHETLVKQVQHSELELVAHFVDIPLCLSHILTLKPGDVLPIDKPEHLTVHVDGVPVFTGQYGTLNGRYALRVERLINPILQTLNKEQPDE